MSHAVHSMRTKLKSGACAVSMVILTVGAVSGFSDLGYAGAAFAEESTHGTDHESGPKGKGGKGKGGAGGGHDEDDSSHSHDDDGDDDTSHDDSDHADSDHGGGKGGKGGSGKSGANADSAGSKGASGRGGRDDDKGSGGAQSGKAGAQKGQRPPWAQEGIPEIELGRLNVARAPRHVLDRAYDEALASFTADMASYYNLPLAGAIDALSSDFKNQTFIDSPLQNLALLRDIMENGTSVLNDLEEVENSDATLAAIFLGTASDKTIPVTPETAYAVGIILGFEMSADQAAALANDAELVRVAILQGHG